MFNCIFRYLKGNLLCSRKKSGLMLFIGTIPIWTFEKLFEEQSFAMKL